jgi:hypothetical protein
MIPKELELKKADSRGRLILGSKYKDKYMMVVEMDDITVIVPVSQYIEEMWEKLNKKLEGIEIDDNKLKTLIDKTRKEVYKEIYG